MPVVRFLFPIVLGILGSSIGLLSLQDSFAEVRGVIIEENSPAKFVRMQTGKTWAVVIGINAYQQVPHLGYAVADAKGMAEFLTNQGFEVVSFYDEKATRRAILSELGDRLPMQVGPLDRVVIFFAGHGETRQFGNAGAMGYLLPVDAQPDFLSGTTIDMGVIRTLAHALPAKHVLFLIDVCYGGIAGHRFRSFSPMTDAYVKVITREKGRQLITAGGADQQAIESPEWGHSAFTHYLLNGLGQGLADLNDDGIIPTSELYSYVEKRVYAAANLVGHTQRPELWRLSADQGEFVFFAPASRLGKGRASPIAQQATQAHVVKPSQKLEMLQPQVSSFSNASTPPAPSARESSSLANEIEMTVPSSKVQESSEQQCEQGNGEMCFQLASQYVLGNKLPQNIEKGAGLLEKGCRSEHLDSCTALGTLLWLGNGMTQDKQLALSLWKFACKRGNSKACHLLSKNKPPIG